MKRLNQFSRLSTADQSLILDLCDKLPYKKVAETLARPRSEGGLDLTTSPSNLCKFFTRHHRDAIALEAIGQFATAIRVNQQAHGEANFEAILGLVQNRILRSLRDGTPIADLDRDFRNLQRVQKCFLADTKHRAGNERTQEAYLDHIKKICLDEDLPDYIDNTLEHDPGAGNSTREDFENDSTQLDLDLDFACALTNVEITPASTFLRAASRIIAARLAADRKQTFLRLHNINPAFALPELDPDTVTPAGLLKLQQRLPAPGRSEISPHPPSKTPAISSISNNFVSPNFTE